MGDGLALLFARPRAASGRGVFGARWPAGGRASGRAVFGARWNRSVEDVRILRTGRFHTRPIPAKRINLRMTRVSCDAVESDSTADPTSMLTPVAASGHRISVLVW